MMSVASDKHASDILELTIFHFNDVYNVESQVREPKGGAARFVSALRRSRLASISPSITLFSGDALSPSTLSGITKGEHMVRVLNLLDIDCAVIGNHDFDHGMEALLDCLDKSNFPWLNTNCFDVETGTVLADCPPSHIIQCGLLRIGLIGLVEPEWVVTLSTLNQDTLNVEDFIDVGNKWAKRLKEKKHCHIVIALTHMRWPNDLLLGDKAVDIDLILGGHDHDCDVKQSSSTGVYVIKSGTDFRDYNSLNLKVDLHTKRIVSLTAERTTLTGDKEEDEEMKELISSYTNNLDKLMCKEIGHIHEALDLRFDHIRTEETNAGNFVCDIMLTAWDADVALLNSGTLRTDAVVPVGPVTVRDLSLMLPFLTEMVLIECTGEQLVSLLENSVSQYPKMEGRFLQVGGVSFVFNPLKPSNQRIDVTKVFVGDETLSLTSKYRVVTTTYVGDGNDGFDAALQCPRLMEGDDGPDLLTCVRNYFRTILVLQGFRSQRMTHHLQRLISRRKLNAWRIDNQSMKSSSPSSAPLKNWSRLKNLVVQQEKDVLCHVAPKVEGRIQISHDEEAK